MSLQLKTEYPKLTLDFNQKTCKSIIAKQYDKGSRFVPIQCTNNGQGFPVDRSIDIQVKILTPDNRALLESAAVSEDGSILLELTDSMLAVPGKSEVEVILYDPAKQRRLSAMKFYLLIEPGAYEDDRIIASDEFNALTDYVFKVGGLADQLEQCIADTASVTNALDLKADILSPSFTGTPQAPTAPTGTSTSQLATTAFVQTAVSSGIAASDAMIIKGTLGTDGTVTALPATYRTGWTYRVVTAGTYAGQECEIGDLVIALTDRSNTGNLDSDWCVAQTNINGAITGIKNGDAYIGYSQTGSVVTITHQDVVRTNTTSGASPSAGESFTAVKSVTSDAKGHVTGIETETVTLPNSSVSPENIKNIVVDLIYPIGAIYISVNSTNPGTLFGGTWEQLQNRFLLAAGSEYAAGSTGGSKTAALTTANMPKHSHTFTGTAVNTGTVSQWHTHSGTTSVAGNHTHTVSTGFADASPWDRLMRATSAGGQQGGGINPTGDHQHTMTTGNPSANHIHSVTAKGTISETGSGTSFNILPPYLAVYMWKRTA